MQNFFILMFQMKSMHILYDHLIHLVIQILYQIQQFYFLILLFLLNHL